MSTPATIIEPLERAIIDWIAEQNENVALKQQLLQPQILSRDFTGHGWYLNFEPDLRLPSVLDSSRQVGLQLEAPFFSCEGCEAAVTTLWLTDDGWLSSLEIAKSDGGDHEFWSVPRQYKLWAWAEGK